MKPQNQTPRPLLALCLAPLSLGSAATADAHAPRAAALAGTSLAAATASAVATSPLQEAGPEGQWEGIIALPGSELGVTVDLARADGEWRGSVDIPAQGATDVPLTGIRVGGDSASFAIEGIPGGPTFRGVLSAGGDSLTGDFTQSGQAFPFRLARTGEAELAPEGPDPRQALEGWEGFVEETMAGWNVPGVAMAVVVDGEVVLSRGFGYRSLEDSLPVTENTLMPIGSSSKAFTALTVAALVDEGLLAWDEPVKTWLPEFEMKDDFASRRMLPADLLTHQSGLPRHDLLWYGSPFSREELVHRVRHLEPSEEFRTAFQYQNLMYATAGYLVGRVTDSSWEEQVRSRILEPLGMTSTSFWIDSLRTVEDHALGYREVDPPADTTAATDASGPAGRSGAGDGGSPRSRQEAREEVVRMEFRPIDAIGPAGSINSNVVDMVRWVELQLGDGTVDGAEVLPSHVVQKTHTPDVVVDQGIFSALFAQPEMPYLMYGLGWFVQPYRGHKMIHHGGNIDGFSALVSFLPDDDIGLVILTNLNGTPLPTVLALSAYDRLLGLEPRDWNARYQTLWSQVEAQQEQAQQGGIERVEGTVPSHPLADYAGAYSHPGYGRLEVSRRGDSLVAAYHTLSMPLEHFHYDVFEGSGEPPFEDLKLKLEFLMNRKGHIASVSVPLEASVDPIVFEREPDPALRDVAYLRRFVGEYELMGLTARVALREEAGTLTVNVPGQPTLTLVPYQEGSFDVEGLEGYSVRFEESDGRVTEMVLIQPGGTMRAERAPEEAEGPEG